MRRANKDPNLLFRLMYFIPAAKKRFKELAESEVDQIVENVINHHPSENLDSIKRAINRELKALSYSRQVSDASKAITPPPP